MPLGTSHVTKTTADKFIPEVWSNEVVAAYQKNLVAANVFTKMSFSGKKGDVLHIPSPTRGSASLKAASTQVNLIAATESEVLVNIDKHYEYSRLIEDIVDVQALASLRQFYTSDAGYALARQVDTDLLQLGRGFNGGNGTAAYNAAYIGSDGSTLYTSGTPNAAAITDAAIRRTIQRLDDNDVPLDNRFIIIPPVAKNSILGNARFTEQAFAGNNVGNIATGQFGEIYGLKVYVSTNADTATGGARIALIGHKDAAVLAEQMGVRSQTQYKQEYLSNLYTSDTIYGVAELRDNACFALAVSP